MSIDLSLPPDELFDAITALSDDDFAELMGELEPREAVIDSLMDHFASLLRPDKAKGVDTVIHVKLWDKPGGGYDHRELVIAGGTCTANATPEHEPKLTIKVSPENLRKVISGDTGPRRLALRGKLRVLGDLGLAMRLTDLFDLD